MNKITKVLIAGITTIATVVVAEFPSLAQSQIYNIRAKHSGQCLNVLNAGRNNGDNVVQAEDCSSTNSQWELIPASSGYYYIRARHSGQCLNVLNAGDRNGNNIVQGDECRSDNFQWALIPAQSPYNYIEAKHSGQCLNVLNGGQSNGENIVQGDECYSDNFQWELVRARSANARPHRSRYNRPTRKRSVREPYRPYTR